MSEIKNCPFCGGKGEIRCGYIEAWIQCQICRAKSTKVNFNKIDYVELAINKWNKRA